jgi:DeoR/GlpR family transcriptional regulator of sugar metabolism
MNGKQRLGELKTYIESEGRVTVADISDKWSITGETARRDLDKLEEKGLILRVHGGAVWNGQSAAAVESESSFYRRQKREFEAKKKIAVLAARLAKEKQSIAADASTTVLEALRLLADYDNLIIVTNSCEIYRMVPAPKCHLISTGGNYNDNSMSFQGGAACETMKKYNVRLALISCRGLRAEKGVLDSYEEDTDIKRAMIEQADEVALLIDHTKFDYMAFLKLTDLRGIDYIITDITPSEEWQEICRDNSIRLLCADRDLR